MSATVEEENGDKLHRLTASISHSKVASFSNSTYVSWIFYFDEVERS